MYDGSGKIISRPVVGSAEIIVGIKNTSTKGTRFGLLK